MSQIAKYFARMFYLQNMSQNRVSLLKVYTDLSVVELGVLKNSSTIFRKKFSKNFFDGRFLHAYHTDYLFSKR